MPIHDWAKVPAGLFHHFHQGWSFEMTKTLNRGVLPPGYLAFVEQKTPVVEPDVLGVELSKKRGKAKPERRSGNVALAPPQTKRTQQVEADSATYARKANRVTIRREHDLGRVVAVVEIVSPGNKHSRSAFRQFIDKSADFLRRGVHLMVLDLFRPTPRDPQGVHKAIFEEFGDLPYDLPPGKPLTFVSYDAADPITAYIEPVAVGDLLPTMPLYIGEGNYVMLPLAPSYDEGVVSSTSAVVELLEAPAPRPRSRRK